jgi:pimeloyl-ACP methyl ester carboxylesterase
MGKVHGGFLKSAQTLASHLHELVTETLVAHSNYELVIVGHSLGGGVATLLALLWARIPLFVSRHVQAISYASPCVVCKDISQAPFTRNHVTCVVTGDDVVSRFGLATFRELQAKMLQLGNEDYVNNHSIHGNEDIKIGNNSHLDDTNKMETSEFEKDKLYCAGRVWWLQSKEYEPHPIVEVKPVKELHEIGLCPELFAIHLPKAYMDSLEKLDQGHQIGLGSDNDICGDM